MTTSRYCTNCGAPVEASHRFCGQCGQAVQTPEAAPRPPQPSSPARGPAEPPPLPPTEEMLGFVAVGKPRGLLGMRQDSYTMIVTPKRLVFASVSTDLMKAAVKDAREDAKRQGKGFLGQWGAQLAWLDVLHRTYQTMTVDAILRQYPGSFAIANHQIRRIRYKRNWDEEGGPGSDELVLRTADGKYRFKLLTGDIGQVKKLLRQTLGRVA